MKVLLSHPSGNTYVKHALKSFQQHACLSAYFTTLGFSKFSLFYKLPWPGKIRRHLNRRTYPISPHRLHAYPSKEIMRLLCQGLGIEPLIAHQKGRYCFDNICHWHDNNVADHLVHTYSNYKVLYSYEDCCLESFRQAKERSIRCFYELPIAYWEASQRLLKEEAQRYPDWEPTLLGTRDSERKLERKTKELELADHVVCPSNFVLSTLPQAIREKTPCSVIPYGAPIIKNEPEQRRPNSKLRVLFAGSLSQRKGLADLFEATRMLNRNDIELVVFGPLLAPESFYKKRCPNFVHEPPRANPEVLKLMRSCDILVLPSIVEGRAIVQLEALACGLPLIITPHTGGEDLIEEGKTGVIVPIRDPEAIAEKIDWFAQNREQLPDMRMACTEKAQEASWRRFEKQIAAVVTEWVY